MTLLIEPKPKPAVAPEKDEPVSRSITIGIACTLLFHLLLLLLLPQFSVGEFTGVHSGIKVASKSGVKSFDIQLEALKKELIEEKVAEKQPEPSQYVPINVEAPENEPDKTTNFSSRNQQSAQEDKPIEVDKTNSPTVVAEKKDYESSAIVQGTFERNQSAARPLSANEFSDEKDQEEQRRRAEQTPLNGFDKTEGLSPDGIATNIANTPKPFNFGEQEIEGDRNSQDLAGGLVNAPELHKKQPKMRPKLSMQTPFIIVNKMAGVRNSGLQAVDAHWREFGDYQQELWDIIAAHAQKAFENSRIVPPSGARVAIAFKLNSKGEVEIVGVEDTNSGKLAVFALQNAITYPQPYRKWTESMIAVLGHEQILYFTMHF